MAQHKDPANQRSGSDSGDHKVRLDKWLWAARFFKTRAMAKKAIDSGKVTCNEQRTKPGKMIEVGVTLNIPQGYSEKTVVVLALSEHRGNATAAQVLYEETAQSIAQREAEAERRRMFRDSDPFRDTSRPNKRERRQLEKLQEDFRDE